MTRELRAQKFDVALLLQNAFHAASLTWRAGIPERIGYARDGRSLLLTKAVPVPKPGEISAHEQFYYLELLRRAGWFDTLPDETFIARCFGGRSPARRRISVCRRAFQQFASRHRRRRILRLRQMLATGSVRRIGESFQSAVRCRHSVRHTHRSHGVLRHHRRHAPPAHGSHRKNHRRRSSCGALSVPSLHRQ